MTNAAVRAVMAGKTTYLRNPPNEGISMTWQTILCAYDDVDRLSTAEEIQEIGSNSLNIVWGQVSLAFHERDD